MAARQGSRLVDRLDGGRHNYPSEKCEFVNGKDKRYPIYCGK